MRDGGGLTVMAAMRTLVAKTLRLGLVLGMAGALAACVTEQRGGFAAKADDKRALDVTLQLARNYIAEENWDQARRHLRTALEKDRRNAETHEALALVFQNTGDLELAEQHYRRALRLDRRNTRVRNNYAGYLFDQGRYREAANHLETVIDDVLYDNRFQAFLSLGRSYMELEEYDKAADAFRRAHLMNRRALMPMLELAEALYEVGEYPESQQFYDMFRQQVDTQTARSLWLGIRLADAFGDEDALASFAMALQNLYPRSREYLAYREFQENR
jgi:type IV pilus assembly protein PilF